MSFRMGRTVALHSVVGLRGYKLHECSRIDYTTAGLQFYLCYDFVCLPNITGDAKRVVNASNIWVGTVGKIIIVNSIS